MAHHGPGRAGPGSSSARAGKNRPKLIPNVVVYHYKPPSNASFGDQPQIPDELATEYLEVKRSDLHVEGLFAVKDIPKVDLRINV